MPAWALSLLHLAYIMMSWLCLMAAVVALACLGHIPAARALLLFSYLVGTSFRATDLLQPLMGEWSELGGGNGWWLPPPRPAAAAAAAAAAFATAYCRCSCCAADPSTHSAVSCASPALQQC